MNAQILEKATEMIKLAMIQEKYIDLLQEEFDEVVGVAYASGWRSTRAEEGERLRQAIEAIKEKVK